MRAFGLTNFLKIIIGYDSVENAKPEPDQMHLFCETCGLQPNEVMMIGGAKLYALTMPYATRLYVTEVDAMIEGDAHFPAIVGADWELLSETPYPKGPKDDYPFTVRIYERRAQR